MTFKYDVNFINPFLSAVLNVLSTMAQVEAKPGKPYINRKRTAVGDVTGVIGITGHAQGAMSLTMNEGAILKIVNNMLMENYTELNEDIADAVGELTNMIAGQARMHLSEQGLSFQAGTPSVITGKGHTINHVSQAPILAIPFSTEDGDFVVEVSFAVDEKKENNKGKTAEAENGTPEGTYEGSNREGSDRIESDEDDDGIELDQP